MEREVKRKAFDEASRQSNDAVRCRIVRYRPNAPGGPKALVVPYSVFERWNESYETFEEMLQQWGLEVEVIFPEGSRFWPNSDDYDILVHGDYMRAYRGEPIGKAQHRKNGAVVPRGWTNQDLELFQETSTDELKAALPHEVRRRAQLALVGNRMFTNCGSAASPEYPQPRDFWAGPLRFDIDQERVEFWGGVNNKIMQASRAASQWATENLRFPKTPGWNVLWRGKIENPLQNLVPSNAVTPYKRFITTLIDPGIIVGAVQAIRTFFKELDGDTQFDFTRIDRHEVVDYIGDVPIY